MKAAIPSCASGERHQVVEVDAPRPAPAPASKARSAPVGHGPLGEAKGRARLRGEARRAPPPCRVSNSAAAKTRLTSPIRRASSAPDRPPGEDEVHRPLAADEAGQERRGHGWEDRELNLRLAEAEVVPCEHQVACERQLAPAAEGRPVDQRHDGNFQRHQLAHGAVKQLEHPPHAVGGVVGHVHAGGKGPPGAGNREHPELAGPPPALASAASQRLQRGQVEHVDRRAVEDQPADAALARVAHAVRRGGGHQALVTLWAVRARRRRRRSRTPMGIPLAPQDGQSVA